MMEDIVQSDIRTEDNHPFVNNAPLILDKRLLNRPPERPSNKSHNDNIIMRKQNWLPRPEPRSCLPHV